MKTLTSSNFKALRQGEFVTASENAGEFIFDSENCELAVATLIEISNANGFKLSKGRKSTAVETLNTQLNSLELPEMNEITDTQKVAKIVANGVEAGHDDDTMLIEIVQAGIKFKAAGKLFNQAMAEGGYRITAKDRKEKGRAILVDAEFAPESYDELQAMIERISEEVDDTTTSQANSICKSYAKEFELELPKAPKKAKSTGGFRKVIGGYLLENPSATSDQLLEHLIEKGRDPERALKDATGYAWVIELANGLAAK